MTKVEYSRQWRKDNPGGTTRQSKAWRAANPEMARAAELRNQTRRWLSKMQYGPVPKYRKRTFIEREPDVAVELPVVQRWLTQEEWYGR